MMESNEHEITYIDTPFGNFYVGQAVTYSVYPLVKDGLGMVTQITNSDFGIAIHE